MRASTCHNHQSESNLGKKAADVRRRPIKNNCVRLLRRHGIRARPKRGDDFVKAPIHELAHGDVALVCPRPDAPPLLIDQIHEADHAARWDAPTSGIIHLAFQIGQLALNLGRCQWQKHLALNRLNGHGAIGVVNVPDSEVGAPRGVCGFLVPEVFAGLPGAQIRVQKGSAYFGIEPQLTPASAENPAHVLRPTLQGTAHYPVHVRKRNGHGGSIAGGAGRRAILEDIRRLITAIQAEVGQKT